MRKIIAIVILVLTTVWATAQPRLRQPEMYIGVHGGALFSMTLFTPTVPGTKQVLNTAMLSGQGGVIFRYAGHKCCGLQVELNYMQRGWRENTTAEDSLDVDVHYKRRLNYIEIPFLAHIFFGKKMVRGFLNVGPQIGYCFSESSSGTKHPNPVKQEQYKPLDNKFDWGLAGGLGMLVRTPKAGVFQLEARFCYSFGDYFKNSKMDYFSKSNPICLSVNVGYLWEIKPKQKIKKTFQEGL